MVNFQTYSSGIFLYPVTLLILVWLAGDPNYNSSYSISKVIGLSISLQKNRLLLDSYISMSFAH